MGLHKSSHTAGAREIGLMRAMASCAPPNTLLIAAPTPRPCPAPTPLSTAATQRELLMVEISKLESRAEVEISKLKVEIRRLKQRGLKAKSDRRLKKTAYIKSIQQKNDQILKITKKTDLEQLEVYTDRFPFLSVRKFCPKLFFALINFFYPKTLLLSANLMGWINFFPTFFHLDHDLEKFL